MDEGPGTPNVVARLRGRQEWRFAGVVAGADRPLAVLWWLVVGLRGVLPAVLAVTTGVVVGAIERGEALGGPLTAFGVTFVLLQVLHPINTALSSNLGDRTAAWLYDELTADCVGPPGMGHLEDPELAGDLQVARDFDLGMTGPPLSYAMDFIADGFVQLLAGFASAVVLVGLAWWAPFVLAGAWGATHWLLKESGVWRDRNTPEVQAAQRDADYAYRLAVDAPAAKELRLFGLAGWTVDRFLDRRAQLHTLQYEATRLRERSVLISLALVLVANVVVFGYLAASALDGSVPVGAIVVYAQAAVGTALVAFGGINWALDGAAAPAVAVLRLRERMAVVGALVPGDGDASGQPATDLRFRDVSFAYPGTPDQLVLHGFDLTIPAGTSLAIVGQNGAGKTTLAKLLCRLYDPTGGAIEVDGADLRSLDIDSWRQRVTAVFQDYIRFELPLRDNVAPGGADDAVITAALADAGAGDLAALDTVLSRSYEGGTDLSGGQWQRVALARALAAVRGGAGVVLLDEPTAQLDVRGEAEIFERILAATRGCTTILISHRFSTVRHADRICVLEHGQVVELGSHDELMAARGRYRTMFDLQAQRFASGGAEEGEEEVVFDVLT
jgi:ABC-type multidrug transport system fused ATPase/permease subunit